MRKRAAKSIVGILVLSMLLTSVTWTVDGQKAEAAVPSDFAEDAYDAVDILKESGDVLVSSSSKHVKSEYDGYILSNTSEALTAKYLKITYTIAEGSSLTAGSKLFNFQPYTEGFGGWQDNYITFGNAVANADGSYTSYISVRDIKESMSLSQVCYGINLSFCSAKPEITLTGYYALNVKATKTAVDLYDTNADAALESNRDIIVITGTKLEEAGIDLAPLTSASVGITPYIKVTKAHSRSNIVFSCMNTDTTSNSSNKALIGTERDYTGNNDNGATHSQYIIHCGFGTGREGTGVGEAGTAIYNKTSSINTAKWSGKTAENISLRLQVRTKDTECKLLGVVFANGTAFTVNEDGSITKGFDTSDIKAESDTLDATDVREKSEAELKAEADEELWQQLRNIKSITVEDCLSKDLYDALQTEAAKAQAAMDDEEATAATLLAALESLNKAVKNATNEAPLGLKKAIDYCKAQRAEDYSRESFAKLAPAISKAETVYEQKDTKTDAELKAARDALEAVRVALVPNVSDAESDPKDFRILSKKEIVKEMGAGINLGNTMDGGLINPGETSWQAYKTTKAYIKALHDAGYNTVRIPVTWNGYIKDDYSIDEAWIGRVQEIVDYCVEQDMYAIINIHHDGAANHDKRGENTPTCWLDTYQWDIEKVYQKYAGVWKTIAERFKDYDEHLIFESMNEVTDAHTGSTNEDDAVLNALNQLFINTVRATGSNNTKRWLAITGRFATTTAIKTMPEDTLADMGEVNTTRLMFSVHIYKDNSNVRWTYNQIKTWQFSLSESIKAVQALDANMPLYVGEYGVRTQPQTGSDTGYNNAERALYYETCAAVSDFYGAVPIVWDQGTGNYVNVKTEKGLFTDWDRPNLKPVYDDVVHGTIRGAYETGKDSNLGNMMSNIYMSYGHSSTSDNGVSKDPVITAATELTLSDTSVILKAGERATVTAETDSARDIVLWATQNDSVATVSRGMIHAKNVGVTTVRAKTQSDSAEKEIKVIVTPGAAEAATSTAIQTDKACYKLTEGGTATIQVALTPAESKDKVTYTSSDTDIATVDEKGKVTGVKAGKTYIILTAASGVSNIVSVHVSKKGGGSAADKTNPASKLESVTENKFVLAKIGDTMELELSVTPADSDSSVTFYSTNSSVAAVDNVKVTVDADGKVKIPVTAVSNGTATIVGITENGLKVLYAIGVGDMEVSDLTEPADPTPEGLEGSGESSGGEGSGSGGTGTGGTGEGTGSGGTGTGGTGEGTGTGGTGTGGTGEGTGSGGTGTGGTSEGTGSGGTGTGGTGEGTGTGGTQTEQKDSLTLKKKNVIIAAGKSVTISFTASSLPKVTTSSNKVATAKVNGNKVVISVPKKAVKGASAKIRLTVASKSVDIKVTVQNPAKKVKAVKKTVTVKKKKTVTAKFKVTATNKKKAAADTIKATSKNKKVAKIVSSKVKKGKAEVKIRGVKKGKTKVTLKIGKKSAIVTVAVH